MNRTLVRNGTIVTPDNIFRADLLIVGESITEIAPRIEEPADSRVVDATDLHILPGLIDAHVHLRDPGATHKEDFTTGTRAALAGGVTTVLDMPNNPIPTTTLAALQDKRELARRKAVCDYGLFVGGTPTNAEAIAGCNAVGIKLYMGATTGDLLVAEFDELFPHFEVQSKLPLVVHAEDNDSLKFFERDASRDRHSAKRPPLSAALAVSQALALAEESGRRLHVAHVSTAREIELVRAAKSRGAHVSCEVTPQHLFLTVEDGDRLGPFGIVNPPLRSRREVRALWTGLAHCDLIATDHAPHTIGEKQSAQPPSGMPGLETTLPLLLTAANENRLTLQDIARLTSHNPARVYHLARKGNIARGNDADLVFVRLDVDYVLHGPWQTKCNWSPFEGRRVRGQIMRVLLRGREVVLDGQILAEAGSGREVETGQI